MKTLFFCAFALFIAILARAGGDDDVDIVTITSTVTPFTVCTPCPGTVVEVFETDQLITSCETSYSTASTLATKSGDYQYSNTVFVCPTAPCEIVYNVPCPTCYVCAWDECYAPPPPSNSPPPVKHIIIYVYVGEIVETVHSEEWQITSYSTCSTYSKYFPTPTIWIINDITIDITVAPTICYYTSTCWSTETQTQTVTAWNQWGQGGQGRPGYPSQSYGAGPGHRSGSPHYPSSAAPPPAPHAPAPVPPPSPPAPAPPLSINYDIVISIGSGIEVGAVIVIADGEMGYAVANAMQFGINGDQLYDSNGDLIYLLLSDLIDSGIGKAYAGPADSLPAGAMTAIWAIVDGHFVVTVVLPDTKKRAPQELSGMVCNDDGHIYFGSQPGSCTVVSFDATVGNNTSPPNGGNSTVPAPAPAPNAPAPAPIAPAPAPVAPAPAPVAPAPAPDAPAPPPISVPYSTPWGNTTTPRSSTWISAHPSSSPTPPPSSNITSTPWSTPPSSNYTSTPQSSPLSTPSSTAPTSTQTPTYATSYSEPLIVQEGPWSWYSAVGEILFTFFYEDDENPGPSEGYLNLTYTNGEGIFQFNISENSLDATVTNFNDSITDYLFQVGTGYVIYFIANDPGIYTFHFTSSFNQSFDIDDIIVGFGSPSMTVIPLTNPPTIDQTGRSNDTNINGTTTVTVWNDAIPAAGVEISFGCAYISDQCNFFVDGESAGSGTTNENGQFNVTLQSALGGTKQVLFAVYVDGTFITQTVAWTVNQLVECQGMNMSLYTDQDSFNFGDNVQFYVGQSVEAAVLPYDINGNAYVEPDVLTVDVVVDDATIASYGYNFGSIITVPAIPASIVTATYLMTFNTCPVVTQTATWLWGIDCSFAFIVDPISGDTYDEGSGMEIYAIFPPLANALVEGMTATISGYNDAGDIATPTIYDNTGDVTTTVFYTPGDVETPNISVWVQDVYSQSAGCLITVQPTWTTTTSG